VTPASVEDTWLGTARLRVGYAWDRWLPYLTGGAAFGNIKMTPNTGLEESKTKVGWTAGGGVEWSFAGPWSAKLEYLYVDLGKATCGAACVVSTDVSFKASVVRLGVKLPLLLKRRALTRLRAGLGAGPSLFRARLIQRPARLRHCK
jgi:opacity protein-like surface antigen